MPCDCHAVLLNENEEFKKIKIDKFESKDVKKVLEQHEHLIENNSKTSEVNGSSDNDKATKRLGVINQVF